VIQYANSSFSNHKTWSERGLEIATAFALASIAIIVCYIITNIFNKPLRFRVRFIPHFPDQNRLTGQQNVWLYFIENKSLNNHIFNVRLCLPTNGDVQIKHEAKDATELKYPSEAVISEILPGARVIVKINGLGAGDVQGTGADVYLKLSNNKIIRPKRKGPQSFDEY
jgi:hypothetical protein